MGSAAEPKASDCSLSPSPQRSGEPTPTSLNQLAVESTSRYQIICSYQLACRSVAAISATSKRQRNEDQYWHP
jgi:hypothetical protein